MTVTLDELMQVDAGELNIGFADVGAADSPAVLLLHGCKCFPTASSRRDGLFPLAW
jgi:hypothetical protein